MDTVIWIIVGLAVGIGMRVVAPRNGLGGIIGDMMVGLLGAGVGAYAMATVDMGHHYDAYPLLVLIVSGAFATGMLVGLRALTNQSGVEDA